METGRRCIEGALESWKLGAFGTLGFQYFYAGRPKTGICHVLMGLLLWGILGRGLLEPSSAADKLRFAFFMMAALVILSVSNYYKIKRGNLSDAAGQPITD